METLNLKTLGRVAQYSTLIFGLTNGEEDIYANFISHKYNILERYGKNQYINFTKVLGTFFLLNAV